MTDGGRYDVIETPVGWRVMERNANGDKVHQKIFRSEVSAWRRANQLTAQWLLINATANVRKRAKNRCECLGECDRGHKARCGNRDGESDRIPGGAAVVLSVIAINHDTNDLREANLRVYCQLCRLYHDAEEAGTEALFTIGATDGS